MDPFKIGQGIVTLVWLTSSDQPVRGIDFKSPIFVDKADVVFEKDASLDPADCGSVEIMAEPLGRELLPLGQEAHRVSHPTIRLHHAQTEGAGRVSEYLQTGL